MPEKHEKYQREYDYCTGVSDRPLGLDVKYACYLHNKSYSKNFKPHISRKEADRRFRNRINSLAALQNKRFRGFLIKWLYYMGVRLLGWIFYRKW